MAKTSAKITLPNLTFYFQSKRASVDPNTPAQLVKFIQGARKSLDVAIYDLKEPSVLAALKTAAGKVKLRIRYDAGKGGSVGAKSRTVDPKASTGGAIVAAGLKGVSTAITESGHLMHNKFIVRDNSTVWTGSGNFTNGGLTLQDNNYMVIDSAPMAKTYSTAFDELTATGKGPRPAKRPTQVTVGKVKFTVRFTTQARETEDIEQSIAAALKGARKLRLAAMLVSDPGLLQSLFDLKTGDIQGVLDPNEMKVVMKPPRGKSKIDPKLFWFANGDPRFVAAPAHAFSPTDKNDFMHNKLMVIDDRIVVTGSYNFSENAEKNAENMIIIESPQVAKAYSAYFDALFAQYKKRGAPLPPR